MLQAHDKKNFETLRRASSAGHLALMEATERATGARRTLVCAVNIEKAPDNKNRYQFIPLAVMVDGNPFELYDPPTPVDIVDAANNIIPKDHRNQALQPLDARSTEHLIVLSGKLLHLVRQFYSCAGAGSAHFFHTQAEANKVLAEYGLDRGEK